MNTGARPATPHEGSQSVFETGSIEVPPTIVLFNPHPDSGLPPRCVPVLAESGSQQLPEETVLAGSTACTPQQELWRFAMA